MSCDSTQKKAGLAGVKCGLSKIQSQVGHAVGRMTQLADSSIEAGGRTIAPVSNRVLKIVDRPATMTANLAPLAAAAAIFTQARTWFDRPPELRVSEGELGVGIGLPEFGAAVKLRHPAGMVEMTETVTGVLAMTAYTAAASRAAATVMVRRAKQPGQERTLTRQRVLGRQEIRFSQSRLTGWLNRRDVLVNGSNIISSTGAIIAGDAGLWHRGTSVIKTAQGEQTITHLLSLTYPPVSYYFDRALADKETAEVLTQQAMVHKLAGYAGSIGVMESLSPGWANAKRAMILTRLHWPSSQPRSEEKWMVAKADAKARTGFKPIPARRQREVQN